jgi:3-oxoacyl-[acyl-carrier-protein] synthase II
MTWDIIGMGAAACLGDSPGEIFDALCAGRSGLAPLRVFDRDLYRAGSAYEIDDREGCTDVPGRATRWLRTVIGDALRDAGLDPETAPYPIMVGTTLRELRSVELWWRDGGRLELTDLHFAEAMHAAFGTDRTYTVASACAASLYALGMGTDLIALGETDIVVVAGTDSITESSFGGLDRVQNPTPDRIRPFSTDRRGMLMAEGAVAVVLRRTETSADPHQNGDGNLHRPYARVRGVSMNCDASHPTVPDAASVTRAICEAHERAAVKAADVDMVVVHGSGTHHNDIVEAYALREVFGGVDPGPLVTSIKGGVGHTCGGSGLLSLVMAVLAMERGIAPPIADLEVVEPEADGLRLVAGRPATGGLRMAQINAIGLGGINAVALVEGAA